MADHAGRELPARRNHRAHPDGRRKGERALRRHDRRAHACAHARREGGERRGPRGSTGPLLRRFRSQGHDEQPRSGQVAPARRARSPDASLRIAAADRRRVHRTRARGGRARPPHRRRAHRRGGGVPHRAERGVDRTARAGARDGARARPHRQPELGRATLRAQIYTPEDAARVGYLDEVVPAADVLARAKEEAAKLGALSRVAYHETKKRLRGKTIERILSTLDEDMAQITLGS